MSEMIERVAEALYRDDMEEIAVSWHLVPSYEQEEYRKRARAAIEAMREPTPDMTDAADAADLDVYWSYRADGRPGDPGSVFRVMIDGALNAK